MRLRPVENRSRPASRPGLLNQAAMDVRSRPEQRGPRQIPTRRRKGSCPVVSGVLEGAFLLEPIGSRAFLRRLRAALPLLCVKVLRAHTGQAQRGAAPEGLRALHPGSTGARSDGFHPYSLLETTSLAVSRWRADAQRERGHPRRRAKRRHEASLPTVPAATVPAPCAPERGMWPGKRLRLRGDRATPGDRPLEPLGHAALPRPRIQPPPTRHCLPRTAQAVLHH